MNMQQFNGNWSFSKLMVYENCALRFKLAFIDKLPELPREDNNPLERGNRVHKRLEDFVKTGAPLKGCEAIRLDAFMPALEHMRGLYEDGMVTVEENWIFDEDWNLTEPKNARLWMKLDVNIVDADNNVAIPIDYKTGKSQYKVVEHVQQLQLYAAAAALKYPDVDRFNTEIWYVDEGHVKRQEYTREQALQYVGRFDSRAARLYSDRYWKPNANKITCKWCPYSPRGTGACPVGV